MSHPLPVTELQALVVRVLAAAGAVEANAVPTADALIAAELDGIASHGLSRAPFYADQIRSGKVDGKAIPTASRRAAALIHVDAQCGLAFPAIDLAFESASLLAPDTRPSPIPIAT